MSGYVTALNSDQARARAKHWIDRAPAGWVSEVREPRRTNEQNDKMWAMLTDVAAAKPDGRKLNPDQWKALFMDACGRETGDAAFLSRWEPGLDGETVVNIGHKSSRLNKSQMCELIDFIDAWGSENGVTWSEPNKERAA